MSLPSIFPTLEPSLPFLQSPLNLQDLANHFYFCNTFPSKLYLTPFFVLCMPDFITKAIKGQWCRHPPSQLAYSINLFAPFNQFGMADTTFSTS